MHMSYYYAVLRNMEKTEKHTYEDQMEKEHLLEMNELQNTLKVKHLYTLDLICFSWSYKLFNYQF